MVPRQAECFVLLQFKTINLKERIDKLLDPHKQKMAASNFVKILTAPKQKYFDQSFRFS